MAKKKTPVDSTADEQDQPDEQTTTAAEGNPVSAEVAEEYIAGALAGLPVGSHFHRDENGWRVVRGAQHSEGKTLARAILTLGSYRGPHPERPSNLVLLSEHGDVLPPE